MKAGVNTILVSVDRTKEHILKKFDTGEHIVTADGVELEIDTQWELLWHTNQNAIVEVLPSKVTMKNVPELAVGDHILINHNQITEQNKVVYGDKVYYKCKLDLVLGIVKGADIMPCNKRVFLEKVRDFDLEVAGFTIPASSDFKPQLGTVAFSDPNSGIYKGDTAFFPLKYRYDVLFNGRRLYCFPEHILYGAVILDSLLPYGKHVTILPDEVQHSFIELPDTVTSVLPTTGIITAVGKFCPPHLTVNKRVAFKQFPYPTFNGEYIMLPETVHFKEV